MCTIEMYTTVGSRDEAVKISTLITESKLAACAQITEIESFFHWEGFVNRQIEFRILFKTIEDSYFKIQEIILDNHSYDLPAIHAIKINKIYEPYRNWIIENSNQ
ncbi:MAG TPA: divalent-cation tolerance protein CutA [Arenimonas sp.]|nr:divalent-cation tolerance protein CutA [Arenimonas sp.]